MQHDPALQDIPTKLGVWVSLLKKTLGSNSLGPHRSLGYRALYCCINEHRHILERALVVTKSPDPDSAENLYSFTLRTHKTVEALRAAA